MTRPYKWFSILLICLASGVYAGEALPIGTLTVSDGGTVSNKTTGWGAYSTNEATAGGLTQSGSFNISPTTKITLQCRQACYVCVDQPQCNGTIGIKLAADQVWLTDINTNMTHTAHGVNSDGGSAGVAVTYTGGWISVAPVTGASCVCPIWWRSGRE